MFCCTAISRVSISLWRFSFRSNHVHVFSWAISPVCHLKYQFNYHHSFWIFHTGVCWWSFTGVWVTTSLAKSPGHLVFLPILPMLNNAVVWMDSARPSFSKSSKPLTKPLRIISSTPAIISTTTTFIFQSIFVLWQYPSTCLVCRFLVFSRCGPPGQQSPLFGRFSYHYY